MSYKLNLDRLAKDIMGAKGLSALKAEGEKIKSELVRARETLRPQAEAQLKKVETAYAEFLKRLAKMQGNLNASLKKAKKAAAVAPAVKKASKKVAKKATKKTASKKK